MFYKIIILPFIVCALTGCSTTDSDTAVHIDIGIDLVYLDQEGQNLLNPGHADAITEANTNLYFLEDGTKRKVFESNLDCPKMFCIWQREVDSVYFMRLFPNVIKGQDTASTYIEFSDGTMDTIKVEYIYDTSSSVHTSKVWYNDELKFNEDVDGKNNPYREITIEKRSME